MDLHTGQSIWLLRDRAAVAEDHPPLARDERCEVAVVGAGITGALVADRLTAQGIETVVLDCRSFGLGSTSASTNLLLYETDAHLEDLAGRYGTSVARRVYELGLAAIDTIERLTRELGDGCGFARRPSLYLASEAAHVPRLRREFELRREMSFDAEWCTAEALAAAGYSFTAPAAIRSPGAAQVDALRLTRRLLQRAARRGSRQYARTEVVAVEDETVRGVRLRTAGGHFVAARAVVFATGYEADRFLAPAHRPGHLTSTWALASEPVDSFPGWPDRALVWETSRPYLYTRTTDDGRVIVGGEDEPWAEAHADPAKIRSKAGVLLARFRSMFPEIPLRVATAWAGTFGGTADGLPYIGRPPGRPASWFALGYGGNGITLSAVAADIVADLLAGRDNDDAQLFRFDR